MKKIIMLLMVGIMVFGSTVVFADDTTEETTKEVQSERSGEKRAKVLELFEQYNPSATQSFEAVASEHKSFHENVRAEKEIIKSEYQVAREALKDIASSGDLSEEEVKAMYEQYKSDRTEFKSKVEVIKTAKKTDVASNEDELAIVRESLREEIKLEVIDGTVVSELLDQVVELLEKHLEIDLKYYNELNTLRINEAGDIL